MLRQMLAANKKALQYGALGLGGIGVMGLYGGLTAESDVNTEIVRNAGISAGIGLASAIGGYSAYQGIKQFWEPSKRRMLDYGSPMKGFWSNQQLSSAFEGTLTGRAYEVAPSWTTARESASIGWSAAAEREGKGWRRGLKANKLTEWYRWSKTSAGPEIERLRNIDLGLPKGARTSLGPVKLTDRLPGNIYTGGSKEYLDRLRSLKGVEEIVPKRGLPGSQPFQVGTRANRWMPGVGSPETGLANIGKKMGPSRMVGRSLSSKIRGTAGIAGVAGLALYGAFSALTSQSSAPELVAQVAGQNVSSTGFDPGFGGDYQQSANQRFIQSTEGLVQGLHRSRH